MSEEHLTPSFEEKKESNVVGIVALIFSIIGLILFISIFGIFLWIGALLIGLILWIIGLFIRPRGKAIAAVIISIIPLGLVACACGYLWNNIKAPVNEFGEWAKANLTEEQFKDIDQDRFNNISQFIVDEHIASYSWVDLEELLNNTTGSNYLEKGAYFFFDFLEDVITESLDAYNNWIVITPDGESNIINWSLGSAISFTFDEISSDTWDTEETGEVIEDDTVCIEIYEPVCGVDGNVYWNSCFLEKAGVELDETATATESGCVSE